MRYAFVLLFAASTAFGAAFDPAVTQVCSKFFTCGHYEGTGGEAGKTDNRFVEKVTLTATGDLRGTLAMVLEDPSGQAQPETWNLDFEFRDDGRFVVTSRGHLYAAGICAEGRCTYGMIPFTTKDGAKIGNAGIFRFSPDRLERFMYVIDGTGVFEQYSDLARK